VEREALRWIIGLAASLDTPVQFCGGLAAMVYGSSRGLNDIDLFVPASSFRQIVSRGSAYISKPAQRYKDESEGWSLEYVQFMFKGIKIEVGSADNIQIYNREESCWEPLNIDFGKSVDSCLFGVDITVMPCDKLVEYKRKLGRKVDMVDIANVIESAL